MSFIEDEFEVWNNFKGEVCPVEFYQVVCAPEAKTPGKPRTLHGQYRRTHMFLRPLKSEEFEIFV